MASINKADISANERANSGAYSVQFYILREKVEIGSKFVEFFFNRAVVKKNGKRTNPTSSFVVSLSFPEVEEDKEDASRIDGSSVPDPPTSFSEDFASPEFSSSFFPPLFFAAVASAFRSAA